jgi:hypothetical protein
MQLIPTRIHGYLDYLMGVVLIASPWIFDFADGDIEQWVPIVLGAAVILYSLLTDYELGAVRVIPMPAHLLLDVIGGVLLAASPWIFGFDDEIWEPHLILGVLEVVAGLLTSRTTTRVREIEIEPDSDRLSTSGPARM